jgi:hypothetical protein
VFKQPEWNHFVIATIDERRRRICRCHRERAQDRRACPRSTQKSPDPALFPLAVGSYALHSFSLPGFISLNDHTPQITDQPRVRPGVVSANRAKHVILSMAVPPTSDVDVSTRLVSAVFGLIDALEKINLRPETKSKLKKTRENFSKSLKDEAEREAREEAADAKLTAKRRAEEERIARLSAAEQLKVIHLSFYILALVPFS